MENEGFNTQKRQGYNLEHPYSKDYEALKNHYYLIQIGHMIAQILEGWESLWKGIRQSLAEASKDSGVPEAESAKGAYAGIGAKSTNSIRLRYPRERR